MIEAVDRRVHKCTMFCFIILFSVTLWCFEGMTLCNKSIDTNMISFNHYMPVSHDNWRNLTFSAGKLFPSHESDPNQAPCLMWDSNPEYKNKSADDNPTELSLPSHHT